MKYAVREKLAQLVENGLAEKHPKFRGEYKIFGSNEDVENQEDQSNENQYRKNKGISFQSQRL